METDEPCNVRLWVVAPTVSDEVGVMVVRAVRLVMSLFTPLAAAPRLVRAPEALVAPVPPLVTGRAVDRVRAPNVGDEVVAMSCGKDNVKLPLPLTITWLGVPVTEPTPLPVATMLLPDMVKPLPRPMLSVKPPTLRTPLFCRD